MRKPHDFHRFFLLWMRHYKHVYHFKLSQWLLLRSHVAGCDLCQRAMEKNLRDHPRVGAGPTPN